MNLSEPPVSGKEEIPSVSPEEKVEEIPVNEPEKAAKSEEKNEELPQNEVKENIPVETAKLDQEKKSESNYSLPDIELEDVSDKPLNTVEQADRLTRELDSSLE